MTQQSCGLGNPSSATATTRRGDWNEERGNRRSLQAWLRRVGVLGLMYLNGDDCRVVNVRLSATPVNVTAGAHNKHRDLVCCQRPCMDNGLVQVHDVVSQMLPTTAALRLLGYEEPIASLVCDLSICVIAHGV